MRPSGNTPATAQPRKILIVGGGIAGIEALMALTDLGDHRLQIEVIADKPAFVMRPQMIGEPWGGAPLKVGLDRLCRDFGAKFSLGTVVDVDMEASRVTTAAGDVIRYDRLLLAPGARSSLPFAGTRTIGFGALPRALATSETGTFAVIAPSAARWTLPAYELALLIAGRGRTVRVVTSEDAPLEAFGPDTYAVTRELLQRHGVIVDNRSAQPILERIDELADSVVSLPLLVGPAITGLPTDSHGFIKVGPDMRVRGAVNVFAAGDATAHPIKQGGLGSQQADTAAAEIVRSCGADDVPPKPYSPVLRGKLTTFDGEELYLRRELDGHDRGVARSLPLWQPAGIVCAWRLARWLSMRRTVIDDCSLDHVAQPWVAA